MARVDFRVGDCCRLLKTLPSESIDLCLFSPPYDHLRTYSGQYSFDYQRLGKRLFRVMKPGGVCVVVIGDGTKNRCKTLTSFRFPVHWCDEIGWGLWETLIYHRGPPHNHVTRFRLDHEYIHVFVKGNRPKTFNKEPLRIPTIQAGMRKGLTKRNTKGDLVNLKRGFIQETKCRGSVWSMGQRYSPNSLKINHPATFPDQLARDIITCFSAKGDVVLDPYVGSGTTCVQSYLFGRHSIGFDISADYVNLAWRRIARECLNDRLMEWVYETAARHTG